MSDKNREYEVWEQEIGYEWKLVATFPTIDEAKELIKKHACEKNADCYPAYDVDYIYRIKRAKNRLKGVPPKL